MSTVRWDLLRDQSPRTHPDVPLTTGEFGVSAVELLPVNEFEGNDPWAMILTTCSDLIDITDIPTTIDPYPGARLIS